MKSTVLRHVVTIFSATLLTVLLAIAQARLGVFRGSGADLLFASLRGAVTAAAITYLVWGQHRARSAPVDWPDEAPRVAYTSGEHPPTLAERACLGHLLLGADTLSIVEDAGTGGNATRLVLPLARVRGVRWVDVWGARLLEVAHDEGSLFVCAVRRTWKGGLFVHTHRPLTAALRRELDRRLGGSAAPRTV